MLVDQPPFYGDGRYPGDGGAALEALWQLMPWREIRNCPGRYTTSDREARSLEPLQLLERLEGEALTAARDLRPLTLAEGAIYVHTLNTESGLIRKVDALGLRNWQCMLEAEPTMPCAEACSACVAVLPFLLDAEKNASAYALVQALRRSAARSSESPVNLMAI
eukprot:symbB.v1.2.016824.t1/scaffold1293.1/size126329/12